MTRIINIRRHLLHTLTCLYIQACKMNYYIDFVYFRGEGCLVGRALIREGRLLGRALIKEGRLFRKSYFLEGRSLERGAYQRGGAH